MSITIIGGGIGGLTLGNFLKQQNIDFKIYESASEIKPVGAGIAMAGNAMQIFDKLGLKDKIENAGTKMHALIITDKKLKTISKTDVLKLEHKYNVCNIAIHRADLQKILSENITENIILNKRLETIEKKENYHLTFLDKTKIESEIVFGADGVKSLVRNQILKSGKIRSAGQKCWRGILKTEIPEKYSHNAYEMWGKGKRFGFVKIILNDIIDLKPMSHWSAENLCLIGDSAHATTPNMGQGGCQAVEDAYVIGKLLETEKDWNKLFSQFEKIRKDKVHHIVNTSFKIGKIAQWENFTRIRDFIFRNIPESVNQKQMEKILKLEI